MAPSIKKLPLLTAVVLLFLAAWSGLQSVASVHDYQAMRYVYFWQKQPQAITDQQWFSARNSVVAAESLASNNTVFLRHSADIHNWFLFTPQAQMPDAQSQQSRADNLSIALVAARKAVAASPASSAAWQALVLVKSNRNQIDDEFYRALMQWQTIDPNGQSQRQIVAQLIQKHHLILPR